MKAPRPRQAKAGPANQLRIIAGKWRSRRVEFPVAQGLRPTGDRIRETLFNWLAADIPGSRCLDAFAGSGALGFEALSRGAREVVFLETNTDAYRCLCRNRQQLEAEGANIVHSDALSWLPAHAAQPFDIIFVDPPFADNLQTRCLEQIALSGASHPETLIYLESPVDKPPTIPAGWLVLKEKRTGNVRYQLLKAA